MADADRRARGDVPDCSTDGAAVSKTGTAVVQSSSKVESQAREATMLYGLSRDLTLAALHDDRLIEDEVSLELDRRNLESSGQPEEDRWTLLSVMTREYYKGKTSNRSTQEASSDVKLSTACGLSREATLAVLPRLKERELVDELERRNILADAKVSRKRELIRLLLDAMIREYQYVGAQTSASVGAQTSSQNAPMEEAYTDTEKTSEVAQLMGASSGSIGTADAEQMQEATADHGEKVAGVEEPGDHGQMQKAADTSDVLYIGTTVAGPSMTGSPNQSPDTLIPSPIVARISPNAVAKRKMLTQDQGTSLSPIKRNNTGGSSAPGLPDAAAEESGGRGLCPQFASHNNLACPDPCEYKARSKHDLQQHAKDKKHKPFRCDLCGFESPYCQWLTKRHAMKKNVVIQTVSVTTNVVPRQTSDT
ncbi:uncharacterized protein LOC144862311 [Branchiostoma floridae x Branchiostoma japonicum]